MGKLDIRRNLTVLFLDYQKLINKGEDIPYEIAKGIFDKLNDLHSKVMNEDPTFTLADHLAKRQKECNLKGDMLPPSVYAYTVDKKFLTLDEWAKFTNSSRQNISQKVQRGMTEISTIKFDVNLGNSLDELNAVDAYVSALKALTTFLSSKEADNQDKIKAIDSLLKHIEPEVISELRSKFQTLNGLINFIVQTLIPHTNKRLRQLVKDIHDKAKAGEDTGKLQIDLRQIFKELLPSSAELQQKLMKEGLLNAGE